MSHEKNLNQQLLDAVSEGILNIEKINVLLDQGADVCTKNSDGWTPLHVLAWKTMSGNNSSLLLKATELLLSRGADVNAVDTFNETPLHFAVSGKYVEMVKLLCDYGVNINAKNSIALPIIVVGISTRNCDILRTLFDHGVDLNIFREDYSLLDLSFTLVQDEKILELLLKKGLDVNIPLPPESASLLMKLIKRGSNNNSSTSSYLCILNLLLKYGADVNIIDSNNTNILSSDKQLEKCVWVMILKHVALLQVSKLPVNPSLLCSIEDNEEYNKYFCECIRELKIAKSRRFTKSWVTLLNLLTDKECKLIKYAGNKVLIEDFENIDWKQFPIFSDKIQDNMYKAIEKRKERDQFAKEISQDWPFYHLRYIILEKILDYL